jgi:hypothetical protein
MNNLNEEETRCLQLFTVFEEEHQIDFESLLTALAKQFDIQAEKEPHNAVKGCLEGCAEHLRDAAMAFYASTK